MYLADVAIGAAGQTFRLLVDTGSPLVVLPGVACQRQGHKFDASAAKPSNKSISVTYGLGAVKGHVFTDRVCVQASGGSTALQEVGFLQEGASSGRASARRAFDDAAEQACADTSFLVVDEESGDLAEQPFDGILGLGLESSAELQGGLGGAGFSILGQLKAGGAVHSTAFALRLGSSGASQLLLGGVDESIFAGGRALWVPLSPAEDGYWQFSVQDLTLDGQPQNLGGLQVAVDSGTSLLAADQELGNWLHSRLDPSGCEAVDRMPKLGLQVQGGQLPLLPGDYVDRSDGTCRLALMPSPLQPASGQRLILGDTFMRRYYTIFDRENQRIGFGVAADDSLAKEMLPAMFPAPTTTAAPSTTTGPPPPLTMDYDQFTIPPTPAPLTEQEVEADQQKSALSDAFSGMGDDLAGSFEKSIAHEKRELKSAAGKASKSPAALAAVDTTAA